MFCLGALGGLRVNVKLTHDLRFRSGGIGSSLRYTRQSPRPDGESGVLAGIGGDKGRYELLRAL
jgi:hypothetical protein